MDVDEDEDDDSGGMQDIATILGIDIYSEAGQVLMAALIMSEGLSVDTDRVGTSRADSSAARADSSDDGADEGNEEEVDMEIDEG